MHDFCGEYHLVAGELPRFEELIEKNSAIALRVAESRDESRNCEFLIDRELDELSLAQEGIHAGVVLGHRRRGLLRLHLLSGRQISDEGQASSGESHC